MKNYDIWRKSNWERGISEGEAEIKQMEGGRKDSSVCCGE